MKNFLILLFALVGLFNSGCVPEKSIKSRSALLQEAGCCEDLRLAYATLSDENKVFIWKEKVSQILQQPVSEQHKELLRELKNSVLTEKLFKTNDDILKNEKFVAWAVKFSKITPESEIKKMFFLLDDYKYDAAAYTGVSVECERCLAEFSGKLEDDKEANKKIIDDPDDDDSPTCACRWGVGCGIVGEDCKSCKCKSNGNRGCGWFLRQSCTGICTIAGRC